MNKVAGARFLPTDSCAARSCTKPRNGARPVPAQTMRMGVRSTSMGKWNDLLVERMETWISSSTRRLLR